MANEAEDQDNEPGPGVEDIDALQAAADADGDPEAGKPDPEVERVSTIVAKSMGWKPEDQWQGDKSKWKPAADFLAEVPDVLKNTRKANARHEERFSRVIAQITKLEKTQRTQEDEASLRALQEAVESGDTEAAMRIAKDMKAAPAQPAEPPAFTDFKGRNDWWDTHDEATAYAIMLDKRYAKSGEVADPEAHFRRIEAGVKTAFPKLFGEATPDPKTERRTAPLVNRGSRAESLRNNGELTVADLTPKQKADAAEMQVSPADFVKNLNKWNAQQRKQA